MLQQPERPVESLLLLNEKYADARVRHWALLCLQMLNNDELEMILLQLVKNKIGLFFFFFFKKKYLCVDSSIEMRVVS